MPNPEAERFRLTDKMPTYPRPYFDQFEADRKRYQHYGDLDVFEMQRVLDDLTYRPGVRWGIRPGSDFAQQVVFWLEVTVEDTYNPGKQTRVVHQTVVHPVATTNAESFIAFVRQCVHKMELHEADEWLKWKDTGKPIFDPHAND